MERFVKRQNIAHYQALLNSGSLDEAQRKTILKLLAEEEMRQTDGDEGASDPDRKPKDSGD